MRRIICILKFAPGTSAEGVLHMHHTPQPALALSHQPKPYALHHLHTRMRCIICIPAADTGLHLRIKYHMQACVYTTNCTIFTVSVCELSLRVCLSVFETSVQAYPKVQIRSSTLAVKLCSRSVASSMLAVKLCSRSVASSTLAAKPGEYSKPQPHSKLCCDHC